MRSRLVLSGMAAALLFAAGAQATMYKWKDKEGHTHFTDTPPPAGVKSSTIKPPPEPPAPPAKSEDKGAKDEKGAKPAAAKEPKKPLTPAEQEMEFKRRIKAAQEAAAKEEKAKQEAAARKENCANARESLRTLESGQRIQKVDAKGERYFIDDKQRAADTKRAHEAVNQWCK